MSSAMTRALSVPRLNRLRYSNCSCSGYWFPHRPGGGACYSSPRADFYAALRNGASLSEAMAELSVAQLERMFPLEIDDGTWQDL